MLPFKYVQKLLIVFIKQIWRLITMAVTHQLVSNYNYNVHNNSVRMLAQTVMFTSLRLVNLHLLYNNNHLICTKLLQLSELTQFPSAWNNDRAYRFLNTICKYAHHTYTMYVTNAYVFNTM